MQYYLQGCVKNSGLKLILLFFATSLAVSTALAQTISGKVISEDDKSALPGVNVIIKGTSNGTITDAGGNYTIQAGSANDVLVFSFVGYTTIEIPAGGRSVVDVTLPSDVKQLHEVVVTALGIEKDVSKIGYATQGVKGIDLVRAREPNAINSLAGKVAGLSIGSSPELLGRPNIVLRGNTDVLFVVNGIPVNSDTWNISADDVDTYTVLKGPNASALYGQRGLNGAIVITTKKGTKGPDGKNWRVDFNSTTMVEDGFLVFPKNNTEYGRGSGYAYSYGDGLYDFGPTSTVGNQRLPEWGPRFEGQLVKQYDSPYDPVTKTRTPTPYTARGVNNLKNFLNPGLLSTNNLAFSKVGEGYDIRVSGSHSYQKGLVPNTELSIENLNVLAGFDLSSRLRLDANFNMNVQHTPNIPDVAYGPNSYVYMFGVYGSDDYDVRSLKNYYQGPMGVPGLMQYNFEYGRENNPYFMANEWKRSHFKTDIYGSAKLTYKFSDALNLSVRTQVTTWNQTRSEKVPAGMGLNTYLPWWYFGWYGDYRVDQRSLAENNNDILLTYTKKFGDWSLFANGGLSNRIFQYNSTYTTTKDLAIPGVYNFNNSQNPILGYAFNSSMYASSAYYSFDLGYRNYFTLSNTGRIDKNSALGSKSYYYPSVALNTVISDYVKMPEPISFLKIRASYADVKGAPTSSQIGSAYQMVTGKTLNAGLLGYGTELYSSYDGPNYQNQAQYNSASYYNNTSSISYPTTLANPNLKPYDISSYEAGLDIRFLQNRLGFDATYFTNINGPLIAAIPNEPATGYNTVNTNSLTTQKKGWELSLKGAPITSDNGFRWDILVNWSTFKETLYKIGNGLTEYSLNGHNYKEGDRMDAIYSTGYIRDGQGDIVFNSSGAPLPTPGGVANNKFLGYANPNYSFGINNKFSYKSLSFSFQFDGRIGGKIYDRVWYQMMNGGTAVETTQGALGAARLAEWQSTKQGTIAPTPEYVGKGVVITNGTPVISGGQITNLSELTFAPNTTPQTVQSYLSSSVGAGFDEAYFISRSYAKLREVMISYKIPLSIFGKNQTLVKTASISLVGRNLLYFAARKDFDIDQYASGYNAQTRSLTGTSANVDLSSPTTRRYGININLGF
jgi:TonB-linked SusC/RagA family outer membrane protein